MIELNSTSETLSQLDEEVEKYRAMLRHLANKLAIQADSQLILPVHVKRAARIIKDLLSRGEE